MKIAIVLGNRMNDDGSLSKIMIKRLLLTLKFDKVYHPDLIITSGGIANELAGVAEGAGNRRVIHLHSEARVERAASC